MAMMQNLSVLSPLLVIAIATCLVLMLEVASGFRVVAQQRHVQSYNHFVLIASAALATAAWLLCSTPMPIDALSHAIVLDGLAQVFGIIILSAAWMSILLATTYFQQWRIPQGEYIALVLLATLGMLLVCMAGDLLVLFIGIEMMSLTLYALVGYQQQAQHQKNGLEAALKYFISGAFASAVTIYGIALIYAEVGRATQQPRLDFKTLALVFSHADISVLGLLGSLLLCAGLLFKMAAVPFHMWLPDVYTGAPLPSMAFMAAAVKATAFAAICRLLHCFLVPTEHLATLQSLLATLSISTMLYGNLLAIRQTDIRRMLAYSGIAHAGYALVGVVAFLSTSVVHQSDALVAIAYYICGYAITILGILAILMMFDHASNATWSMQGIAKQHPTLALCMAFFMLSLAGIPLTVGFFGKVALISAVLLEQHITITLVAVGSSVIGAFYYLRVIAKMYMQHTVPYERYHFESVCLQVGLWVCVTVSLLLSIFPNFYVSFLHTAFMNWLGA